MLSKPLSFVRTLSKRISKRARAGLKGLPTFGGFRTITWVGAGLLLVSLVYLAQSSNAALVARNLRVKEERIQELERQNAQLRYEISAVTSPSSVEARAKRLGLGPAKHVVYAALPALQGEDTLRAVSLPLIAPAPPAPVAPALASTPWGQILSMFGLGETDHAQAQTQ